MKRLILINLFLFNLFIFAGCEAPLICEENKDKEVGVPVPYYVDRINYNNQCEGKNFDVTIFNPWIARSPDDYFEIDFTAGALTGEHAGLKIRFYLQAHGYQRILDYGRNAIGLEIGELYECTYSYWMEQTAITSTTKEGIFHLKSQNTNTPEWNVCIELLDSVVAWGYNYIANHTYKVEGTKLTLKFFGAGEWGDPIILDLDCTE